jgi:hypothetical protein
VGNEVAVNTGSFEMLPLDGQLDYLKGDERTGLEGLGSKDFKVPRIILLQALNPECRAFPGVAIPGNFWHTGANVSLGSKYLMIASIASKKAILFKPRWEGGGILAISNDQIKWDNGGNKSFTVKPNKDSNDTTIWNTGRDVANSGLMEWGTSNPLVENSPPAATAIYEYLVYLPTMPNLSPVLMTMAKTALNSAKALNTTYMMMRKPMSSVVIEVQAKEMTENNNTWYIPTCRGAGLVKQDIQSVVAKMGEMYADYKVDYDAENANVDYAEEIKKASPTQQKDEIPF